MICYFTQRVKDAGGLLFGEQVDLKVQMIAPFRSQIHRILPNQNERGQEDGFKCKHCGEKRERVRVERRMTTWNSGIYDDPQQDEGTLNTDEADRADKPSHGVRNAVETRQLSLVVLFEFQYGLDVLCSGALVSC